MAGIDDLVTLRAELQEFTRPSHEPSLRKFYDPAHGWFNLKLNSEDSEHDEAGDSPRHLTTTMTCIESLYERTEHDPRIDELPPVLSQQGSGLECTSEIGEQGDDGDTDSQGDRLDRHAILLQFAAKALKRPADWKSDKAAYVYCRVRTLGSMLRLLSSDDLTALNQADCIGQLLEDAWASRDNTSASSGLREATQNPRNETTGAPDRRGELTGPPTDRTYPPNAFLTYWGLLALDAAPDLLSNADALRRGALDWLEKALAQQIAFHYGQSAHADAQQLAWSLCAHVRFGDGDLAARSTTSYAQLVAALKAFFEQQDERTGQWGQGQPLFHYPTAGNAYCYVFETLAELVGLATRRGVPALALREALRPYLPNLRNAFDAAKNSRQSLGNEPEAWGWSSGHHPHRTHPEAWATASVYRFAEAFRRLVGYWANEEAKTLLGARTSVDGPHTLNKRGGTWDIGYGSAGSQLVTGYVHHILRAERLRESNSAFLPDPDVTVIPKHGGRSALLYGPPGTGKTTLVKAVAGALRWPFIEITPAQFLDAGVDLASKRADDIFRHVMELNRCVVLLDEIDELIQARTPQAETTERFFTTTMLPRLAHLWEHGRILFFVNTNDVARVDSAIRRGQRFDSSIFVMTPGFLAKQNCDPTTPLGVTPEEVTASLRAESETAGTGDGLGWLALLRHDQIERLGRDLRLARNAPQETHPYVRDEILGALPPFISELRSLDWSQANTWTAGDVSVPSQLQQMLEASRRGHNVRLIVELAEELAQRGKGAEGDDRYRTLPDGVTSPEAWAASNGLVMRPDGVLEAKPE